MNQSTSKNEQGDSALKLPWATLMLAAIVATVACSPKPAPAPTAPPPQGSPVFITLTRTSQFVDLGGDYRQTVVRKDRKHCAIIKEYLAHGPHVYKRVDTWLASNYSQEPITVATACPMGEVCVTPVTSSVSGATAQAALAAYLAKYPQP